MIKKKEWGAGPLTELSIDLNEEPITEHSSLAVQLSDHYANTGLQDAVEGARTPQELRLQMDWGYSSLYDHEADLPIVCSWLENIPEWAFYMEVVRRYVDSRYNRLPQSEVCDTVPEDVTEKLQDALMEYFRHARDIAYSLSAEPFAPEGLNPAGAGRSVDDIEDEDTRQFLREVEEAVQKHKAAPSMTLEEAEMYLTEIKRIHEEETRNTKPIA